MAVIPLREVQNNDSEAQGEQHKKCSGELAVKIIITFAIAGTFVLVVVIMSRLLWMTLSRKSYNKG